MNASDALAELGLVLGTGPLALPASAPLRVAFDESVEVEFRADADEPNVLVLAGTVTENAAELPAARLRDLLEGHFLGAGTGGAWFSLSRDSDTLSFTQRLAVEPMQMSDFTSAVESFVNHLEGWQRLVATGNGSASDESPTPLPGAAPVVFA